jgi:hypothetical protein
MLFAGLKIMNTVKRSADYFRPRMNTVISYFNALYFIEIMNLMLMILLLYGYFLSILTGAVLTALLSAQIIMIYFRNKTARKIQLFLFDVHIAAAIPSLIQYITDTRQVTALGSVVISMRIIMILSEALFIYLLTDEEVIGQFE